MSSKRKDNIRKADRTTSESSLDDSGGGWSCVVCCQNVPGPSRLELFALGPCDHIVCYECSTKMRVLCQQNECPICRQDIPKVIFTSNKNQKHAEVDLSKFHLVNNAHHIIFENENAEKAYLSLLENRCKVCKKDFNSLKELDGHLRREHELFVCDLCAENLKVFCHERKYYNRKDLARHRKTGDPDDTSHRGHPLCHFCDVRYMDDDDLHRHLRRDHYYCHFCDPLGLNQFYDTYDHLREHFKKEHFLCEEGPCSAEKFTTVFRSDIDLQAHRAQVHCVTKTDAKQARILSLDFSLKPRGLGGQVAPTLSASVHHQPFRQLPGQKKMKAPALDDLDSDNEPLLPNNTPQEVPRPEDFPSLAGATGGVISSGQPRLGMSYAGGSGSRPRPEDFPSLPSSTSSSAAPSVKKQAQSTYASNAVMFKDFVPKTKVKNSSPISKSSFSSRAGATGTVTSRSEDDFPSLPTFMPPSHVPSIQRKELKQYGTLSSLASAMATNTSARPPSKVSTISSLSTGSNASSSSQQQTRKPVGTTNPTFTNDEFPTLPVTQKQSKKKKKNNAPSATAASGAPSNGTVGLNSSTNGNSKANSEKLTLASLAASSVLPATSNANSSKKETKATLAKKDDSPSPVKRPIASVSSATDDKKALINSNDNTLGPNSLGASTKVTPVKAPPGLTKATVAKAPPGFGGKSSRGAGGSSSNGPKPPPGFDKTSGSSNGTSSKKPPPPPVPSMAQLSNADNAAHSLSSVAQQVITTANAMPRDENGNPNANHSSMKTSDRFDTENGARNSTAPSPASSNVADFIEPSNFEKRNQSLVHEISDLLRDQSKFSAFKKISQEFRHSGQSEYYRKCIELFGKNNFHKLFPELVVLLPDIRKQNELLAAHERYLKYSKGAIPKKASNSYSSGVWIVKTGDGTNGDLLVCPKCQQVLAKRDGPEHMSAH